MASYEGSLQQIKYELYKECPDVGLQYFGVATHVIDIQNFYIVPLSLYRLLPVLESPGRPIEEIHEFDRVIYNSPTLGQLARGVVNRVHMNGSCIIFALDYGVTDMEVTRDNIYDLLNKDCDNIPGLAQLCELSMCFPRGGGYFTEEAVEAFLYFMGQEREKLTITIKEKTNYKLGVLVMSSYSNPDTVSTVLAYTNHSSFYPAPL